MTALTTRPLEPASPSDSAESLDLPIAPAKPVAKRFDALWTAIPFLSIAYLAALAAGFEWRGSIPALAIVPMASLILLAAYGGMLLGLGVFWVGELRLSPLRSPAAAFGQILAGGLLAAVIAALLLPRQSVFRMSEIGPWIFLTATILLLLLAMVKEGRFDPVALARWLIRGGARPRAEALRDYASMMKFGLNALVLVTALVGFIMASPASVDWLRCGWMLLGTALVAGGASAFNQVAEVGPDALMRRTSVRPLPAGRISASDALTFAGVVSLAGLLLLASLVSLAAAATAALTLATYVFLYTPLKRINTLSTLVGAIAGALPPLLGWIAAGRGLGLGGVMLFFILFFWQIPHFLAISWKYRDQYAAGGFPMFSVLDPSGRGVGFQSLLHGAALVVVSLFVAELGMAGNFYAASGLLLGAGLLVYAVVFLRRPDPKTARNLFFTTLIYLPVLLGMMVLDRLPPLG